MPAARASTQGGGQGSSWTFTHYVTALAIDDQSGIVAFGLGNGRVRLVPIASQAAHISREVAVHEGALISLATLPGGGFVSGGDDGAIKQIAADGTVTERARRRGVWIEPMGVLSNGTVAFGAGKTVELLAPDGSVGVLGPHPSTVTGLWVGDDLVIAAHYGGVSLWQASTAQPAEPATLSWAGSHIAVSMAPDRRHLVTTTQSGEIHGWRLSDLGEMRMSGYPGKIRSVSWSSAGDLLVTAGAELLVGWPFDAAGPEGRPPIELYDGGGEALITCVACHPADTLTAAGFEDGALVIADHAGHSTTIAVGRSAPITVLSWSGDGAWLAAGAEDGRCVIIGRTKLEQGLR